jgi:hypothetical protein
MCQQVHPVQGHQHDEQRGGDQYLQCVTVQEPQPGDPDQHAVCHQARQAVGSVQQIHDGPQPVCGQEGAAGIGFQ